MAKHKCRFTSQRVKSKSDIGLYDRGKTENRDKSLPRRVRSKQSQPACNTKSFKLTRNTLEEGRYSHHCANPGQHVFFSEFSSICFFFFHQVLHSSVYLPHRYFCCKRLHLCKISTTGECITTTCPLVSDPAEVFSSVRIFCLTTALK